MFTTYKETIDWLFSQIPMFQNLGAGAYKPGLDTVRRLSHAFGDPHLRLRCIHVAGTNGKGSTASTIAAVLQSAGMRVALYTSPHLIDFRERIRVNGQMISEAEVVDFINRFRALGFEPQPSFFELTTIMAFEYFVRQNVDIAVIEVGLGGRLDATNIITPMLSVITNISLDHTALLGTTPAAIAREKAGIIKPGVPVVVGEAEGDVRAVFATRAAELSAPVTFAQDAPMFTSADRSPFEITYHGTPWGDVPSELTGDCQLLNTNTIFHALSKLPFAVPAEAVAQGFAHVCQISGLMGRWATIARSPRVICDTGHNPGGWQYLGPQLATIAAESALHVVIGFVNDKDVSHIFPYLPAEARYYLAKPSVERGRPAAELLPIAAQYGLSATAFDSVAEAYQAARQAAAEADTIFVGGSTFIVADLLTYLK